LGNIDKKCPFTGTVSIRGRILTGTVVSTKMHRTLIIRREYLHFIPKYSRYEKRHKNLAAHVSPAFRVEEGDQVTVGQCRPLSKTVRFFPDELFLMSSSWTTETTNTNRFVCRSASTFCVCCPELARQSRSSPSSKLGFSSGIFGVINIRGEYKSILR
jgi:ribosomal protein uS17